MNGLSATPTSSATLRAVLETALDAVIVMRTDGTIADWNGHAEEIFGWSRNEAMGRPLSELIIPPVHREARDWSSALFGNRNRTGTQPAD